MQTLLSRRGFWRHKSRDLDYLRGNLAHPYQINGMVLKWMPQTKTHWRH